ncbi:MAG: metalloprotease TldD [Coxiellaceae bacterium]|jgi:TldD protein|nr:metalloprotease TldD [Coxiellaceae bacterium]
MNSSLDIASKILLAPWGLIDNDLNKVISKIMRPGIDDSDVYLQYSQSETWNLEDGLIKKGEFNIEQGFGVRAVCDDSIGFACATGFKLIDMMEAAISVAKIANYKNTNIIHIKSENTTCQQLYPKLNPLSTLSESQKIKLLKEIDNEARKCDPRVVQVNVNLTGMYTVILMVTSNDILIADIRPLVHLNVSVLVAENGHKEYGNYGGGKRSGYEVFLQEKLYSRYAKEAVRIALVNLNAVPAPAGLMPVVLSAGFPAVMLHEAVGHGLEADFNRKKHSIYTGRIGEQVASSQISIVDQGNLSNGRRGSLNFDDEGTPTQHTMLIENGILRSYMYDKLNARLMNTHSTGNGRRASYADVPIPRMTNTFMLPGKYNHDEIISSVNKGIYAVNFTGGQVDITSGEFVFSTSEAYLIERGKITKPIKGATLIGNGPQILNKVVMVGNNLELDSGVGICGKSGQNIPVGVGQPTLKISELTVGGTVF